MFRDSWVLGVNMSGINSGPGNRLGNIPAA